MQTRVTSGAATLAAVTLCSYAILATAIDSQEPAAPAAATFSAFDAIDQAQVSTGTRGDRATCEPRPDEHRFVCGPQDWNWVGQHAGRSAGEALRCLWVHPLPKRARRTLVWQQAPIGAVLRARLALLAGSGDGAAVQVRVYLGDALIATLQAADEHTMGELERTLEPGPAQEELRIEVDAADSRWRLACLQFEMTGARPPPAARREAPGGRRTLADRSGVPRLPPVPSLRAAAMPRGVTPSDLPQGSTRAR